MTMPLTNVTDPSQPQAPEEDTPQRRRSALVGLLRRPDGLISLLVIIVVILVGVLAPLIAPHDPNAINLDRVKAPAGDGYLLGGDVQGRDLFSRLVFGTRATVYGTALALIAAVVLGVPSGVLSGYLGRTTDKICMWISDALQSVPGMIILLIVATATSSDFAALMITIGVFMAPGFFRLSRSSVLAVRSEPYIDAAQVAGMGQLSIIAKHVVRSVRGPIIIQSALTAGVALGMQAGLQFLGLGTPDMPSWGASMAEGFAQVRQHPNLLLWPSVALGITIAALAILGNVLGDVTANRAVTKRRKRATLPSGPHVMRTSVPEAEGRIGTQPDGAPEQSAISLRGLRVGYPDPSGGGLKEVVHGVDLTVRPGEVLGVIGESGSGKSQTIFSLLGLLPAAAESSIDELWVSGRALHTKDVSARRKLLGRELAYIPQEPMSNLDPSYTVGAQLMEPLRHVTGKSRSEARALAMAALDRVGIVDPERVMHSYPHQLSGGMAQRVLIAGAVISRPKVLVADEPTTALDVTVQAEVLELLRELQQEENMALVIVTHNFGVVADLCDRVVVMRQGSIIETGAVTQVFAEPTHDYTRELIDACLDGAEPRTRADAVHGSPEPGGKA
jgi:ABC-type dipeptide/oligopeptide/nickel transport system ATPase component/ABC-type dipeptide/oligopeptide/nickel transport system permease subunit